MKDPVTYLRLALPRAIIGQMVLGFTEHESEAAYVRHRNFTVKSTCI